MDWKIKYQKKNGIVWIKTSGIAGWEGSRKLTEEALECGRGNGSRRFLIDNRNLERALDTLEIDKLPDMLKEAGVTAEDRMALVYESSSPLKDTYKFFRDVAYIASFNIKIFTDIDEAVAWLKSDGKS